MEHVPKDYHPKYTYKYNSFIGTTGFQFPNCKTTKLGKSRLFLIPLISCRRNFFFVECWYNIVFFFCEPVQFCINTDHSFSSSFFFLLFLFHYFHPLFLLHLHLNLSIFINNSPNNNNISI